MFHQFNHFLLKPRDNLDVKMSIAMVSGVIIVEGDAESEVFEHRNAT
jgi:hypothetical protein